MQRQSFKILYQDENLVAINKPSGFHVHTPESRAEKVPRHKIILHQLRDQVGQKLHPLHRLDVATSGVLVFALNSETASDLGKKFQNQEIDKTYWAVVRGFVPDEGRIEKDLESDSSGLMVPAQTRFTTLQRMEIQEAVGLKHPTARYSWLKVSPETGRFHQIRRHMNRISHPVIGDAAHGDSRHNRYFREKLGVQGLCLRAMEMRFHWQEMEFVFSAGLSEQWRSIETLFSKYQFKNSLESR
jgi:tRNA pseudouridine65 synthase